LFSAITFFVFSSHFDETFNMGIFFAGRELAEEVACYMEYRWHEQ
jgi:hypothetical protein